MEFCGKQKFWQNFDQLHCVEREKIQFRGFDGVKLLPKCFPEFLPQTSQILPR